MNPSSSPRTPRWAEASEAQFRGALGVFLTLAFCAAFFHPNSYFRDAPGMIAFLEGPDGSGAHASFMWNWELAPGKYRMLFHWGVDALVALLRAIDPLAAGGTQYHRAITLASGGTFLAAGLALDHLLARLGRSRGERAIGALCWLAFPAVHHAFLYPTDTKEDFLGYAIFFIGLTRIATGRTRGMLLLCLLGALTRETLLLLPGLFLLVRTASLGARLTCLAAAVSVQIAIRSLMGVEDYGALHQGLYYNLANPGSSLLGAWLILGFAWIPLLSSSAFAISGRGTLQSLSLEKGSSKEERLTGLFLPAALVLLGAHIVLGRMNEIRISFLLAPWAILAVLDLLDRVSRREFVAPRVLLWPALVVLVCAMLEVLRLGTPLREAMAPHLGLFAPRAWWLAIYLQLTLTVYLLRLSLSSRKLA